MKKVMTNDDVLNKRYPPEADDKVFLTCITRRMEHGFDTHIDSSFPAVWLDDRHRAKYGSDGDLVIHDRANGIGFKQTQPTHGLHLLSAGFFTGR